MIWYINFIPTNLLWHSTVVEMLLRHFWLYILIIIHTYAEYNLVLNGIWKIRNVCKLYIKYVHNNMFKVSFWLIILKLINFSKYNNAQSDFYLL